METYVYLTTDAREAIALMGYVNYQPNGKVIRMNGRDFPIENLPMKVGRDVQRSLELNFNPMSYVLGNMTSKEIDILVGRLSKEGIYSAHVSGHGVAEQCIQDKPEDSVRGY